jgi:hypothetical protein
MELGIPLILTNAGAARSDDGGEFTFLSFSTPAGGTFTLALNEEDRFNMIEVLTHQLPTAISAVRSPHEYMDAEIERFLKDQIPPVD